MRRDVDTVRLLLRALHTSVSSAGCTATLVHEGETPWSSATFIGAQHRVAVAGNGLAGWLAALPEAELPMRGCFVASVGVERTPEGVRLNILVLDE